MANMLYNGVELPELPEWDRAAYPYAWIRRMTGSSTYYLMVTTEISYALTAAGVWGIAYTQENAIRYRASTSNAGWVESAVASDGASAIDGVIWANFDVLNENGTVFLAATDPVPVSSDLTSAETLQWISLGMAVRRGIRARGEATMYSYNGTVLPKLPEWDRESYPYAYLTYGHFTEGSVMAFLYVCSSLIKKGVDNGLSGILNTKNRFYAGATGSLKEYVYSAGDGYTGFEYTTEKEYGEGDNVFSMATGFVKDETMIWTNIDLYTTENTLYLAASEPIPVYE